MKYIYINHYVTIRIGICSTELEVIDKILFAKINDSWDYNIF